MSEISTEQKLQLIQQVRSQYQENKCSLSSREQILYGNREEKQLHSTFGLRFLAALFLCAAVIFMEQNQTEIAGITAEQVYQAISADFEEEIEKLAETLSAL